MQIGLMVEPQVGGSYDDLLRLARYSESRELDVFARSDHYLSRGPAPAATDAFASLSGLARDTQRIKLCVLVAPITFRHPAVVAKTAATIDEMSGGRFELGVGTGWMELEHEAFGLPLPPLRERFDRLEESLGYLRAAFGDGPTGYQGAHYSLDEIDVRPKPLDLPIIVGGTGPRKTPTLAGRFADEYNSGVDDAHAGRVGVLREAATAAGRDPDAILLSVASPIVMGADPAEYRRRLVARAGGEAEADDLDARMRARTIPVGLPQEVAESRDRLAAAGIGRIYIQIFEALPDIDTTYLDQIVTALRR